MADEITEGDYESLANKLEALDLTQSEKLLLNAIIENANEESEVAGFGMDNAQWLIDHVVTPRRVKISSAWSVGPYRLKD